MGGWNLPPPPPPPALSPKTETQPGRALSLRRAGQGSRTQRGPCAGLETASPWAATELGPGFFEPANAFGVLTQIPRFGA